MQVRQDPDNAANEVRRGYFKRGCGHKGVCLFACSYQFGDDIASARSVGILTEQVKRVLPRHIISKMVDFPGKVAEIGVGILLQPVHHYLHAHMHTHTQQKMHVYHFRPQTTCDCHATFPPVLGAPNCYS